MFVIRNLQTRLILNLMLIHTEERPFSCKACDMKFKNSYGLQRHMTTHKAEQTLCEQVAIEEN